MQITIIASDEFTGNQVEVVVNDGTSTGLPSVKKCREILTQQEARYNTILTYVSHTVQAW